MNQKTRSLLFLGGLLLLLGAVLGLWRLLPVKTVATPSVPEIPRVEATSSSFVLATSTALVIDAASSTPVVSASSTDLRLLMVGDIMLDRNVAARTKKSGQADYPFRKLPADWLSASDLTIANLEGPVTPTRRPPEKSIDFQFDPAWLPVLKAQGFDVFSQANNHALDQGSFGYTDSAARLRAAGFTVFGHQVQDGLISLATTTVKGERLAFLGWNTTDNPIDREEAAKAIAAAKAESDVVITFLHWGLEYKDHPAPESVTLAHWLIDHGVDVVVGGHPHWAQGFSTYKGKPIVWSLGNFVFDQDFSKETQQGLAIALRITPDEIGIQPIPLKIILSQPALEVGEMNAKRLAGFAAISDLELRSQISTGQELVYQRKK